MFENDMPISSNINLFGNDIVEICWNCIVHFQILSRLARPVQASQTYSDMDTHGWHFCAVKENGYMMIHDRFVPLVIWNPGIAVFLFFSPTPLRSSALCRIGMHFVLTKLHWQHLTESLHIFRARLRYVRMVQIVSVQLISFSHLPSTC